MSTVRGKHRAIRQLRWAMDAVRKKPNDAAANMIMGRLIWLHTNNPDKALPYLVKCPDAAIGKIAALDLTSPLETFRQLELADQWWDAANQDRQASFASVLQQRAVFWYLKALPEAKGLSRTKIEKRLQEFESRPRS